MAKQGIEYRGPGQYRARARVAGRQVSRTFDNAAEAEQWLAVQRGKIAGDEWVDRRIARKTTLKQACEWYADQVAPRGADGKRRPRTPDDRNKVSRCSYWQKSDFKDMPLVSITPGDLLKWRRETLDEDNIEDDGADRGPAAKVGPQQVTHRLNTLSQVYKKWSLAHDVLLSNPVAEGVRPSAPRGRDRRLDPFPNENGRNEEERLLAAADKSSRPWLRDAIIVALETCLRQSELAGLTWKRVRLDATHPHADLPLTKNERARRVPLSVRAVKAFKALRELASEGHYSSVLPVTTGRGIAHAFRDAIEAVNAERAERGEPNDFVDLRWHDLRHEAISRLFELTDLRDNEIMAISGHLRAEMLTRYTHLRADRLGARLPGGKDNPHA